MQRDDTSPGNNAQLRGPIDSLPEARLLANFLWNDPQFQHLLVRPPQNDELNLYLDELRTARISGPIDTPREIRIFMDFLKRYQFLNGPVDTASEQEIINKLKARGVIPDENDMNYVPPLKSIIAPPKRAPVKKPPKRSFEGYDDEPRPRKKSRPTPD